MPGSATAIRFNLGDHMVPSFTSSVYTARDPLVTLALDEPIWDPVRGDPRFARLRARMGLSPRP